VRRAFAPGRVNLIGEHTDYNDGLCLPFAIERGVTVTAEPIRAGRFEARAEDLGEEDAFDAADGSGAEGWRAFVRGTVAELAAAGHELPGAGLTIESDLPRGAGLSSSAALEVALALALLALAGEPEPDRIELAKLCSRVENERVGAQTGLLDQLAVLLGEEGHALWLDCRSLETEQVRVDLAGWTLATLGSGASHSHGEPHPRALGRAERLRRSGYNERREECRRACEELGIESLRDASPEDVGRLPPPLDRRVRHVLSENERVERAVAALRAGEPDRLGRLLDASHASLRDDYEVSVPEVEAAVATCKRAGAAGARIMGGGFGGSVLALFPPGAEPPGGAVEVRPGAGARLL
jgi:galactokinase